MSRKYQAGQYTDPRSVVVESRITNLGLIANGSTTPSNGVAGYAKGCLWINDQGSAGSLLYINTGSTTSATWTNLA